jgi:hypothetical protein
MGYGFSTPVLTTPSSEALKAPSVSNKTQAHERMAHDYQRIAEYINDLWVVQRGLLKNLFGPIIFLRTAHRHSVLSFDWSKASIEMNFLFH